MFEVTKRGGRLKRPPQAVKLEIDKVLSGLRAGEHRSLLRGRGFEFKGLTAYDQAAGGEQRINWPKSFQVYGDPPDQFVVNDYYPERRIQIVVLRDYSESMHHPLVKNTHAEMLTWLFALSAFRSGDQFRLFMWKDRTLYDSDWTQSEDDLTAVTFPSVTMKKDIFMHMSGMEFANTLFVVISDFGDEWLLRARELRRLDAYSRNIKILLLAIDEWSGFRPHKIFFTVKDPERGGDAVLDLRGGRGAERAAKAQQERFKKIETMARPLGGFFIPVSILKDPVRETLKGFLRTGFDE